MKTTISFVALLATTAFSRPQPGLPFLLIWPTARSTALAGAMTGLADDPDAAFFNPAGLAFQSDLGATGSYANWLPGLYPGNHKAYGAFTYGIPAGPSARVGPSVVGFDVDCLEISNFLPYEIEFPPAWRLTIGAGAALEVTEELAVGLKAKLVHTQYVPDWVWKSMPGLGIEAGGTGTTWAADVGALWRPSAKFSLGGSVANLSPGISYASSGEHDPSPAILRIGACWTPIDKKNVRLRVLPEWDKVLVGMFFDTAGTKTFGQELQTELRDAWKSLAVEVSGLEFVTLRLGYFEDMSWKRGGLVFEEAGRVCRHNICDVLTRRGLGTLKSVGLCWGFGIGYKDYFRIDVSSDAAIYDFPTKNWRFSLVANDIAGEIRELRQGHAPWEE